MSEGTKVSRFCLKSEDEMATTFWSPLKMRAEFGPLTGNKEPARTCPTSPNLGMASLDAMAEDKKNRRMQLSKEIESVMEKGSLSDAVLIRKREKEIKMLKGLSVFEKQQLI